MRIALALGFVLLAAGCVTPASDIEAANVDAGMLPHFELTDAHDHKDRASHAVAWNMELLGWDPIAPSVDKLGRYNHVQVSGTRAFVTAYALEKGGQPGLAVFNISGDEPVLTATLATPDITVIDVHVSDDGKYAVVAGHRDNRVPIPAEAQTCTGTPLVDVCTPFVPSGIYLVDVSDETNPRLVDRWASAPSGAHTAKVERIGDEYFVFIASYGFSYASRVASHVEVLVYNEGAPGGARLEPASRFFAPERSGNDGDRRIFVHDMYVEAHPDGRLLMYVSYWDGGVVIADVTDPRAPTHVASWTDFDASLYGNIHFARPIGMIGDRHISFAAPEFGSAEHAGEAYVLDTTDITAPKLLTKWVLPGDPVNDGGYRFSPHNFDPYGSKLVYAHYHGGVWVLDLAMPEEPVVKAYVFPTVPEGEPAFEATEDAPNIWAAVWAQDGTIWASDIGTGLYHYRMVSEEPGVAPYEAHLAR